MTSLSDFPPDVQAAAQRAYDRWMMRDAPSTVVVFAEAIMADRAGRTPAPSLTARQADCLRFIADYQTKFSGLTPTYEEIMWGLGLSSKSGVNRLVNGLEERGVIKRLPNRSRAITIIANPN